MSIFLFVILVIFTSAACLGFYGATRLSCAQYLLFFVAGALCGAIGLCTLIALGESILDPPQMQGELQSLSYLVVFAPIGSLLGAITFSAYALAKQHHVQALKRICFIGALPAFAVCGLMLFGHPAGASTANRADLLFTLLFSGTPLLWIALLWLWAVKQR